MNLVLLHGLTGSGACWAPVVRALGDRFDVVTPDARGHGSAGFSSGPYRYEDLAADVIGLMKGLSEPVLLGHSMGGMTAAVVAGLVPLRALILVDPTFLSPPLQYAVFEGDAAEQHRRSLEMSRKDMVAALRKRHPHRSLEMVELVASARLATDNRAFEILRPPNPDYRKLVAALTIPTLLVIGDVERGAVVSREMADELAQSNGKLRIEHVAGAGHGIPYDEPERLAEIVRASI